jgi:hypothetical protein
MNNGVGYNAALPSLKNVVLGTDGISSDMLMEAKFAYFRHRDSGGPLGPGAFMRYLQSANEILRRYFGEQFEDTIVRIRPARNIALGIESGQPVTNARSVGAG